MPPPLSSPWTPKGLARRRRRADATSNTFSRSPLHLPHALRPSWIKRTGDLDLWPFDPESGVRVTFDVGYLCANFDLPKHLCSRLSPDVRDRQTSDVRRASSLNAPPRGRGIIMYILLLMLLQRWTRVQIVCFVIYIVYFFCFWFSFTFSVMCPFCIQNTIL